MPKIETTDLVLTFMKYKITELYVLGFCFKGQQLGTWLSNAFASATIITIMLPNATLSSHAAWTTDFIDSGAWKFKTQCYCNRILKTKTA